jgi:hypothetical protein
MARQPSQRSGSRKLAKTSSRTASFREAARAIVAKDRYDRRAGFSVDTAGAIARALERAYAQGFSDAQAPPSPPSLPPEREDARGPVEWMLIPPRPRSAFWTICLFTLGRDPAATPDGTGRLDPMALPSGRPGWQLVTDRYCKPFGHATLRPLVRLGLLGPVHAPEPYLVVSARGQATWWRFLERGGQYPEDLTDPAR